MDQGSAGCALREHMRLLLFAGLLLSETQILVNLKTYAPPYFFPYTTLAYFVLSTAHLGSVFARYALGGGREKGAVLEWYEQIVLPVSVLIISLLSRGSGMVQFKSSCAVMLVLQSLLIIGKVIYFNSVTPELAQISTINKLVRVVKLNVIGLLPLVVQGQLVVVAVVALCQAISLCAFFLKFTYQKCLYEYVLLVCVFCGFVSAVENVFQTIFSLNYLFIGQLGALFFYLHDNNYLKSVLQLKYSSSLANHSQSKQDDEVLAGLLFMQECLFENKRTLVLSQSAQNQGALHASAIMQRVRGGVGSQRGLDPLEASSCELVFRMQNGPVRREVTSGLFQAYCQRFNQTDSFSCFEFTIGAALQLGGSFTNKALVLYYGFIERKRAKASIFQNCKFHYTYQRILKQVEARESDKEDINFIEFSDNLRLLGGEIEECLANELKLVEYLADRSRKVEMMTDGRIFARNQHKNRIRCRMEKCIDQRIYFCSNQFKFLFLLYHITIQKRYLSLREQLKRHFLASQVQQLRYADSENSLIVLSGFNHGEIINSNEVFKNHFGLALSSFARSNVSEFIPTEKQRARHAALMAQAVESRKQRPKQPHSSYECLLAIEREMGSVKLKVVQSFSISIRIHYENSGTFNYICSLAPFQQQQGGREKDTLTLLRRDCQNFTSKGLQLTVVQTKTVEQLDEKLELTEIDYTYDSQGIRNSNNLLQRTIGKERGVKIERYLQEKTLRIEKKMMEEGTEEYRCGWSNVLQMAAILILAIFILVTLGLTGGKIDNLKLSISQLVMPVAQAQLVHSKILLEQEILSLQAQTPYFPDDLCLKVQLPSISNYITSILYVDLEKNTDDFIKALSLPHDFGPLGENIYVRKFSSIPYRLNPVSNTISYQKHIQLMKSQTFSWLSSLRNITLDYLFYSDTFPGVLYNSTIDGPQTLTSFLQNSQNAYINDLSASLSELRVISLVLIGVLGALAVGLRLRDNRALMNFIGIIQCIPSDHLGQRIRELKSAIGQLHQLRGNRIEAIQFDHAFTVQIKKDKLDPETLPVEEFAQWHMKEKAEYELEDSEGSCGELDREFQHHKAQEPSLGQGEFIRLLKYKKLYLAVSIGLLVCIMALSDLAVGKQRDRLDTLVLCSAASLQLSIIQQKFINLAAYNWLKVLSLQKTDFNMTQAKLMFKEATDSLLQSTYLTKIPAAYSKDFSDQVLYGDVCNFFKSRQACLFYRNNIFSSGLSMVIPFVVKEMIQIDQLSSNYSYYILNMCDKTWLLFDGIVPMTNNISAHGFKVMTERSERGFSMRFIEIAFITLLLLIATIIFQYRRYRRERIIREEVFSLDTVQNLYAVAEFKPYFNSIYYS